MEKQTKALICICVVLGFLAIAISITTAHVKKIASPEYLDRLLVDAKHVQDMAYEQMEKNNQLLSLLYIEGVVVRRTNYLYNIYYNQGSPKEFEKRMIDVFGGWDGYLDFYDTKSITDDPNYRYCEIKNFFSEKTQKLFDEYNKKVKEESE